jgi:hypothetical protein
MAGDGVASGEGGVTLGAATDGLTASPSRGGEAPSVQASSSKNGAAKSRHRLARYIPQTLSGGFASSTIRGIG